MAYVRISGVPGRHIVAVCRQSPALLTSIPRNHRINIEGGCFGSPRNVCYSQQVHQQQRSYSSSARTAATSWLKRKLYTVLAVVGISGGALILVSVVKEGHQLE